MTTLKKLFFLSFALLFFIACKKDDVIEDNDNELITTVELSFTKQGTSTPVVYTWKDTDGPGGSNPVIEPILLDAASAYNLSIRFLDESKNPAENITQEINAESAVHRIYIIGDANSGLAITNLNNDSNGLPLGLTAQITTATPANGSLRIVLRHYGEGGKDASDPVTSPKASSDADVSFPLTVQ